MRTTFRLDSTAKNIKCVLCAFVDTNQLQTVVGNCGYREKTGRNILPEQLSASRCTRNDSVLHS